MKLIDSNILIYAASGTHDYLFSLLEDHQNGCSVISYIEVLGYPHLKPEEKSFYLDTFKSIQLLPLSDEIRNKSVEIKQYLKIPLGDCIIAATALVWKATLYTRNTADFKNVKGLSVINPIK